MPAIAYYIHSLNPVRELKIHLQGIAIGDAYSDPESVGGHFFFLNVSLTETIPFMWMNTTLTSEV